MKPAIKYSQFIIVILLALTISCNIAPSEFSCGVINHEITSNLDANLLWSKEKIYIFDDPHNPSVAAISDTFFLQALDKNPSNLKIYAYETLTGNLLWEIQKHEYTTFVVNDKTLIEGTHVGIVMYDIGTGKTLQEARFPQPINILYLYDTSDNIFVYGSGGQYYSYNKKNDKLTATPPDLIRTSYIKENNVLYADDPDGFKAIETISETLLWKIKLDGGLWRPVFSEDMIFFVVGTDFFAANLYALNKNTGEILWKKNLNIISNIEVKDSKIYFITLDGYLIILDKKNGDELLKVNLSPQPFILPYSNVDGVIGAYTVAADPKNDVVVISLGDSCQLLALQIKK